MDVLFDPAMKLSLVVNENIANTLTNKNIFTIKDFLELPANYPIKLPRTNISKLQKQIRSKHNIPVYLHDHTWLSLSCYYSIKDRTDHKNYHIQRGTVGPLAICEHMVFVIVIGNNNKQYIRTASSIIMVNELWKNCDIISDSEDEENIDEDEENIEYKNLLTSNANEKIINSFNRFNILPVLQISKTEQGLPQLTTGMQKCLKSSLTEANTLVRLLKSVHIKYE